MFTHPDPTGKLTHTPVEVAPLLGIGRSSIYGLLRSGQLRSVRVGRKIIIPKDAIVEFLSLKGRAEQ